MLVRLNVNYFKVGVITVGFWRVRRWLIIRQGLVEKSTAKELAERLGMKEQSIKNLVSAYNKKGITAIEVSGRGQRQKAYLTLEEEKEFLNTFTDKASEGYISTTAEIKIAFEKHIGKQIDPSTIYRLLKRHNWRKIKPRAVHPKANKKEQESFKKTLKKK